MRGLAEVKRPEIMAYRSIPPAGHFTSQLAKVLQDHALKHGSLSVFDLSRCSGVTISTLAQYRAQVAIGDIYGEVIERHVADNSEFNRLLLEAFFTGCHLDSLRALPDVVLCWDLLNYLSRDEIEYLFKELKYVMSPLTKIHALIVTVVNQSASPGTFELFDSGEVSFFYPTRNEIVSPQYTPRSLIRYLEGYRLEHMKLLQSGFYEVCFSLS